MSAQKRALRALERARRAQRDSGYWRRIGEAIEQVLGECLPPLEARPLVVGCFAAIDGEPILQRAPGVQAWPRVAGEDLVFHVCARGELVPGWRSILEPPTEAPVRRPDVILVPGLAFSPNGARLGRGKGFYDRYLRTHAALTIGLTDEAGLYPDVPSASFDYTVDVVVTERHVYVAKKKEQDHGDGRSNRSAGAGYRARALRRFTAREDAARRRTTPS